MAEGPACVARHPRPSRRRRAVVLALIALLAAAPLLNFLGLEPWQARGPLDRLSTLLALPALAVALVLAWQLRAAARAAERAEVLHRLDAEGAHLFPLVGRPRSLPWHGLEGVRRAEGGVLLSGRDASGRRTGFLLTAREERQTELLAVLRHYRPDLSDESGPPPGTA